MISAPMLCPCCGMKMDGETVVTHPTPANGCPFAGWMNRRFFWEALEEAARMRDARLMEKKAVGS